MLDKIVEIKGIGRFRNYSAHGDVAFRKLTLIYAENGRGKTTLCAIFRSLQSAQSEYITERKTLGVTEEPIVHIRFNEADYRFANGTWTNAYSDITIFDPVFVNENVYSGEYVGHDQKRNLYRVIVGAEGVRLAKEIDDLDEQIREASSGLRNKKTTILSSYFPGIEIELEDCLQWQPSPDIEDQISQKTKDLDIRKRADTKSSEIYTKGLLLKIQLPSLPSDFFTLLKKQLTDIVGDAEVKIREQIKRHKIGREGESWLSQGLGYVVDDRCPFCGQGVATNELITAYRAYFSTAYADLKREISQLPKHINDTIGETSIILLNQKIAANETLVEFWRQFITVDLPSLSFTEIQKKYVALREQSLSLAGKKQHGLTEVIQLDESFNSVLAEVDELRAIVGAYNATVDNTNILINKQKVATHSQSDISALEKELAQLMARKKRFEPEVMRACQVYQDALLAKKRLENKKRITREHLDQYCEGILQSYEQTINEYLDQFNAGFRITNTRHRYTGGKPSSHYQIEINNTVLDLGDVNTPGGTPCFKTSLSSGDRSALALAFFLAVVKQDTDICCKIVVFDDPFTSMDCFRRSWTQQSVRRILSSAQQVIVLSHEASFLNEISVGLPRGEVKTLQMSPSGQDNTIINWWDVNTAMQSAYRRHYNTLYAYECARDGDPLEVAMAIRPFLETLYRVRFPEIFLSSDNLGNIVGKARHAVNEDRLQLNHLIIAELDAINQYTSQFHHGESPTISADELHGFVRRALKLR